MFNFKSLKKVQNQNKERIRIAFFVEHMHRQKDGAIRTVYQIIDRLPEEIFDIYFFVGDRVPKNFKFKHKVLTYFKAPMASSYSYGFPLLTPGLKKVLDNFKPDLIHITSPSPMGVFAANYAIKNKIPITTIYHTNYYSYLKYFFKSFPVMTWFTRTVFLQPWNEKVYNNAIRTYVPTANMIEDLSKHGIRNDNMVLWGRGIDKKLFNPKKRSADLQNKWGEDKRYVLFASRLVWEKELKTLINVYKKLDKHNPEVRMIICGDGPQKKELEREMPHAIFTGMLPHNELAEAYASAEVFIFTSISETYGNVVVEAMASGLPTVVAAGGGSMDHVNHGKNGYLVKPKDANEMYTRTVELLEDDELRKKMSREAIKFARSLSWEKLAKRLFNDWERFALESRLKRVKIEK